MSATKVHENVKAQAPDLGKEFPRGPRQKLGGYVLAARALDKCRAELAKTQGEYHYACPMDRMFLDFAGIDPKDFKKAVAEGRNDEEMDRWIREHAKNGSKEEVIRWSNELRDKRISDLDIELQVYLEEYIEENVPEGRVVYHWFDVYDLEEGRL
ncbi:DUF5069 domain-containing protein [Luteolibacter sp. GHJ8]|uniref:DUF5069 domain-containing protein n=1 Tax=Luteolibacter rhizosphaerae TaxID=2989719 RepID=A0ABT3G519_9BACT|nr:DUF5069 domain-containing protein [Luteolibacter rhizosphaerae]MCW1914952.1 DUF5069 domain-containing protein [Luteolibacter rhizosphaerae]